ncbi:hypothetical protein E1262_23630 [Jiangella aurantiaca]|uniref:Uncharacterized protein n=1 Tax=Jiangella aurantiaca TaxID=2530373 RepID=A0A4V2YRF8_9ACTN|nr:hypothetical protein [Jiangella aurantiaca]TDD65937.1 hypothetical protein E1262_23630 [Jiangella aurantiaca]
MSPVVAAAVPAGLRALFFPEGVRTALAGLGELRLPDPADDDGDRLCTPEAPDRRAAATRGHRRPGGPPRLTAAARSSKLILE